VPEHRYRVPTAVGRAELREKGSRFIALVEPVADEDAATQRLAAVVERYADASHHCWARRLGEPARERSADAGEPAGTAGVPMLQVLRGAEISDVLAVVIRWFGGTKLGKGGLARAYAGVVRAALAEAPVGERFVYEVLEVEVPYARLGALKRLIHPPEVVMVEPSYGEVVRATLRVLPSHRAALLDGLASLGVEPRGLLF
jgi:uncharacterized YigZ family protein